MIEVPKARTGFVILAKACFDGRNLLILRGRCLDNDHFD